MALVTGGEIAADTIVLRELKGSPLSTAEFDWDLETLMDWVNDSIRSGEPVDDLTASRVVVTDSSKILESSVATAENLETLVDGSNADALHTHNTVGYYNDADLVDGTAPGNLAIIVATGALAVTESAKLRLASVDSTFNMIENDTLTLVWTGSLWLETGRSFAH